MDILVTIDEQSSPRRVTNSEDLGLVIRQAGDEARARRLLNVIFIEVPERHVIGMVVGGEESALTFTYDHRDPPCLESVGPRPGVDPVLTCYVSYTHYTELPRRCVISYREALRAVDEFASSGKLPSSIQWTET
jgi:Immunity protein Imm1